jgi:hypothetical protein
MTVLLDIAYLSCRPNILLPWMMNFADAACGQEVNPCLDMVHVYFCRLVAAFFLKLPTVASDPPSSNCMQQEGKFQPSWLKIDDDITGGKKAFFFSTVAP